MWLMAGPQSVLNNAQEHPGSDLQWSSLDGLHACWHECQEPSEDQGYTQVVSEQTQKQASI